MQIFTLWIGKTDRGMLAGTTDVNFHMSMLPWSQPETCLDPTVGPRNYGSTRFLFSDLAIDVQSEVRDGSGLHVAKNSEAAVALPCCNGDESAV